MVTRYEDYLNQGIDPLDDSYDDAAANAMPPAPPPVVEPPNVGPEGDVVPTAGYQEPAPAPAAPPPPTGREFFERGGDIAFEEQNIQLPGDYGKSFSTNEDYIQEKGLLSLEETAAGPPDLPFDQGNLEHGFFTNTDQQLTWWQSELDRAIAAGDTEKINQLVAELERFQGFSDQLSTYLESPAYQQYLDSYDFWNVVPAGERESPDLLSSMTQPIDQLMTFANVDRPGYFPETGDQFGQQTVRHDEESIRILRERQEQSYQDALRRNRDAQKLGGQGFLIADQNDPVARLADRFGNSLDAIINRAGTLDSPGQVIPFLRQLAEIPARDQATLLQLAVERAMPADPLQAQEWMMTDGLQLVWIANQAQKAADIELIMKSLPDGSALQRMFQAWRPQTMREYEADWTDYFKVANKHLFGGTGVDRILEHTIPFAASLTGMQIARPGVESVKLLAPEVWRGGKWSLGRGAALWSELPPEARSSLRSILEYTWIGLNKPAQMVGEGAYARLGPTGIFKVLPELATFTIYNATWLPQKTFQTLMGAERMILPSDWGEINLTKNDWLQLGTAGVYQPGFGFVSMHGPPRASSDFTGLGRTGQGRTGQMNYDELQNRYRSQYHDDILAQIVLESVLDPIDYIFAPLGHAATLGRLRHLEGDLEPAIKLYHPEAHASLLRYFDDIGGAPTLRDALFLRRRVRKFSEEFLPGIEEFFAKKGVNLDDYPAMRRAISDFQMAVYFQLHHELGPGGSILSNRELQQMINVSHDAFLLRVSDIGVKLDEAAGVVQNDEYFQEVNRLIEEGRQAALRYETDELIDVSEENLDEISQVVARQQEQQADITVARVASSGPPRPAAIDESRPNFRDMRFQMRFEDTTGGTPDVRPSGLEIPGNPVPPHNAMEVPDPPSMAQVKLAQDLEYELGIDILNPLRQMNNGESPTATQLQTVIDNLNSTPVDLSPSPVSQLILPGSGSVDLGVTNMVIRRDVERQADKGLAIERYSPPEIEAVSRSLPENLVELPRDLETLVGRDGRNLAYEALRISLGRGENLVDQIAELTRLGLEPDAIRQIVSSFYRNQPTTPVLRGLMSDLVEAGILDQAALRDPGNIEGTQRIILEALRAAGYPIDPRLLSRGGLPELVSAVLQARQRTEQIIDLLPTYRPGQGLIWVPDTSATNALGQPAGDLRGLIYQLQQHGASLQLDRVYGPVIRELSEAPIGPEGEVPVHIVHTLEDLGDPRMALHASPAATSTLYGILMNWHYGGGDLEDVADAFKPVIREMTDEVSLVKKTDKELEAIQRVVTDLDAEIVNISGRVDELSRPVRLLRDADYRIPGEDPRITSSALYRLHEAMQQLDEPVRRFSDFAKKTLGDIDDPYVEQWVSQISIMLRQYKSKAGLGRVSHQVAIADWIRRSDELVRTRRELMALQRHQAEAMAEMAHVNIRARDKIVLDSRHSPVAAQNEWALKNLGLEGTDVTDPTGISYLVGPSFQNRLANVTPAEYVKARRDATSKLQRTSTIDVLANRMLDPNLRYDPSLPPVARQRLFPQESGLNIVVRQPKMGRFPAELEQRFYDDILSDAPEDSVYHWMNETAIDLIDWDRNPSRKEIAAGFRKAEEEIENKVGKDAVLVLVTDPDRPWQNSRNYETARGKYRKIIEWNPETGQITETFPSTDTLRRRQKPPEAVEAAMKKLKPDMTQRRKSKIGAYTVAGRTHEPTTWSRFENLMTWLRPGGRDFPGVQQPIQVIEHNADGIPARRAIYSLEGFDRLTTGALRLDRLGIPNARILHGDALTSEQRKVSKQLRDAGFFEMVPGRILQERYPHLTQLEPRKNYMVATSLADDFWTYQASQYSWIDDAWGKQDYTQRAILERTETILKSKARQLRGVTDPNERYRIAEGLARDYIETVTAAQDEGHWMADMTASEYIKIMSGKLFGPGRVEYRENPGAVIKDEIRFNPGRDAGFGIYDYDQALDAIDEVIEYIDSPKIKADLSNWRRRLERSYAEEDFSAEMVETFRELAAYLDENYDQEIYSISDTARRMVFDQGEEIVDPGRVEKVDRATSFRTPRSGEADYAALDARSRERMRDRSKLPNDLREREVQRAAEMSRFVSDLDRMVMKSQLRLDGSELWFNPENLSDERLTELLKQGYIKPGPQGQAVLTELAKERIFIHGYTTGDLVEFHKVMIGRDPQLLTDLTQGQVDRFVRAGLIQAPDSRLNRKHQIILTEKGKDVLAGNPVPRREGKRWDHAMEVLERTREGVRNGEIPRFRFTDFTTESGEVVNRIVKSWWRRELGLQPRWSQQVSELADRYPRLFRRFVPTINTGMPDGWQQVLKQDHLRHAWSNHLSSYYSEMQRDRQILSDRWGIDGTFGSAKMQMTRVSETVGFHLKTMFEDMANRKAGVYQRHSFYEDARRMVKGLAEGDTNVEMLDGSRINPFLWFESFFRDDEHGRITLKAYQDLGSDVVKSWHTLSPHASLHDLSSLKIDEHRTLLDILPAPPDGDNYTAAELQAWDRFFFDTGEYFGLTDEALDANKGSLRDQLDTLREMLASKWNEEVRPELYRFSDEAIGLYDGQLDSDPPVRKVWHEVDSFTLDQMLFTSQKQDQLDIDGLIENLESAFAYQYGRKQGWIKDGDWADPKWKQLAKGTDQAMMNLQLGIKRWMTPLWMTTVPRYHVNNFVSNIASILIMLSRGDNKVAVGNFAWVREMSERVGSGFNFPTWVTEGFTQQREALADVRHITDTAPSAWKDLPIYARRLPFDRGKRINPFGWLTLGGVYVGDVVERSAKTWLYQSEWAGVYTKHWHEAVDRVFARGLANATGNIASPGAFAETVRRQGAGVASGSMEAFKAELLGARGLDEVRAVLKRNMSMLEGNANYREFMESLMEGQRSAIASATNQAYVTTAHALRDYRMRNKLDTFLDRIIPIHYWTTKNWLMVGATVKDKPWRLLQGMRAYDHWAATWEDEPSTARNKVHLFNVPPDSGPWSGAKLWLRPNQWINPAFFSAPAALLDTYRDWNRYEDMGLWDRIQHMTGSGLRNLWDAMGYRVGPQYETAVTLNGYTGASDRIAEDLGVDNVFLDKFGEAISYAATGDGYYYPGVTPLGSYESIAKQWDPAALFLEHITQKVQGSRFSRGELTSYGFQLAEMYREGEFGEPGSDDAWMGFLQAFENLHQYSQGDASEPLPVVRQAIQARNGDRSWNSIVSHLGLPITPVAQGYQLSWEATDEFYELYDNSQLIRLVGNPSAADKKTAAAFNREIKAAQKKKSDDLAKGRDFEKVQSEFDATLEDIYSRVPRTLSIGNSGDPDAAWDFLRNEHPEILALWLANDDIGQVQDAIQKASARDTDVQAQAAVDSYYDTRRQANSGVTPFYDRLGNLDDEFDKQIAAANGNRYLIESAKTWYRSHKQAIIEEMIDAGYGFNPTGNIPQHGESYYAWRYGIQTNKAVDIADASGSLGVINKTDQAQYIKDLLDNDALGAVDRRERQQAQRQHFMELTYDMLDLSRYVGNEVNPRFADADGNLDRDKWMKAVRDAAPAAVALFDGIKASYRNNRHDVMLEADDPNNRGSRINLEKLIIDTGGAITESEWIEAFVAEEEQASEWYGRMFAARDLYRDMGNDEFVEFEGQRFGKDELRRYMLREFGPDVFMPKSGRTIDDYPNMKLALSQDEAGDLTLADVTDELVEGGEAWQIGEGRRSIVTWYWNDLSLGQRKRFRDQYPDAFTFNEAENRYDFDSTKLSGDQVHEIRQEKGIRLPGQPTPRENENRPRGWTRRSDTDARAYASEVNETYRAYYDQDYLSPEQKEQQAEWDLFLTIDPKMEAHVQDERKNYSSSEDDQISWNSLARMLYVQGDTDAAEYIWARSAKWDQLGMSEIIARGEDFLRGPEGEIIRKDDPEWEDRLTDDHMPQEMRQLDQFFKSGSYLQGDEYQRFNAWTSFNNAEENQPALEVAGYYKKMHTTEDNYVSWAEVPDLLRRYGFDDEALVIEQRNELYDTLGVSDLTKRAAEWLSGTDEGQTLLRYKSTTDYSYDWYLDYLEEGSGSGSSGNRSGGTYSGSRGGYSSYRTAGSVSRSSSNYRGQNQADPEKVGAVMGIMRAADPLLLETGSPDYGQRSAYAKAASDAIGMLLSLFAMTPGGDTLSRILTYNVAQKLGGNPTMDRWELFLKWLDIDPASIVIEQTPPMPPASPAASPVAAAAAAPSGESYPVGSSGVSGQYQLPELPGYVGPGGFNR